MSRPDERAESCRRHYLCHYRIVLLLGLGLGRPAGSMAEADRVGEHGATVSSNLPKVVERPVGILCGLLVSYFSCQEPCGVELFPFVAFLSRGQPDGQPASQ